MTETWVPRPARVAMSILQPSSSAVRWTMMRPSRTATGDFRAAIPTTVQISNYLASNGGRANPNGLYLISSGGNDVAFALGNTGAGPYPADPNSLFTR